MDAVAAQVVDVGKAIVGRERREVRVRALLAIRVGAVLGVVLGPDDGAEPAIGHFEAGSAAAAIIGGEKHSPRVIEGDVAGACGGGVFCGKWLQFPVAHAEARDFTGGLAVERVDLCGCEKKIMGGREGNPVDGVDFRGNTGGS